MLKKYAADNSAGAYLRFLGESKLQDHCSGHRDIAVWHVVSGGGLPSLHRGA